MERKELSAVVLFSGGFDSMAVMEYLHHRGIYDRVYVMYFDYGNRNMKAEKVRIREYLTNSELDFEVEELDYKLPNVIKSNITTGGAIGGDEYVPMRNLQFLSIASAYAEHVGARDVYIGVIDDECLPYPDANTLFLENFDRLVGGMTGGKVRVIAPFAQMTKDELAVYVVEAYGEESLARILNYYISCNFAEGVLPCGKCSSCEYDKLFKEHYLKFI